MRLDGLVMKHLLQRRYHHIPYDESIIRDCCWHLDLSAHTAPPLTTVNIPTKAIGKCAASRLIRLIRTNDPLHSLTYLGNLTSPDRTQSVNRFG